MNNKRVDPAIISLNIAFTAKGEFSVLKDNDWFGLNGYADGTAGAELLSIGYTQGDLGVKPLRKGIYLDLRAGAHVTLAGFKYEITPYYKRILLMNPL